MYELSDSCSGWKGSINFEELEELTPEEEEQSKVILHFVGDLLTGLTRIPEPELRAKLIDFTSQGILWFKSELMEKLEAFLEGEAWTTGDKFIEELYGSSLSEDLLNLAATEEEKLQILSNLPPNVQLEFGDEDDEEGEFPEDFLH